MKTIEIPTTIKNQKRVEERREQIVLAAIKVFSKKGFHRATLRDLSKEIGISHGNIYDYVASKEDIFFLIHQYIADLIDSELTEVAKEIDDPVEKLRQLVKSEFNFISQWEDAILLLYQEGHVLGKDYLHNLLKRERDHVSKYEAVLQECIERNVLRPCNVRVMANFIKVMIDSLALKRWDLRGHGSYPEIEECFMDFMFNGLMSKKGTRWNVSG
jgi:AcrR family transcriptional regulator